MNGAPQSSIFVIVVQLNKLDIWMMIAWLSFSLTSRTYQISFRLFFQLQTWHMIPFYHAWSIITANQCAALQILPTIVPWPFLIFITRWYWWRRSGLSPTPCVYVALLYNFRQNALAEELSGSTDCIFSKLSVRKNLLHKRSFVDHITKSQCSTANINIWAWIW